MKRFLFFFLLLTMPCLSTLAQQEFETGGINYRVLTEADESQTFGTVEVIPRGEAFYEGDVVIPNGVKSSDDKFADSYKVVAIAQGAFKDNVMLRSVSIPGTVERIGEHAFENCAGLESVVFAPGNLKEMGREVFRNSGLRKIVFAEGLTDLPWLCFFQCEKLEEVVLPASLRRIGASAFAECHSLKTIDLPKGLQEIMLGAFRDCALEGITLPTKIAAIPEQCFSSCKNLKAVHFSPYTNSIGALAFSGCSSLETLRLPDNVSVIGDGAFCRCSSLTDITFSQKMKAIPSSCFEECTSIKGLTFPNNIETIGDRAFSECTALQKVVLPKGLKKICKNAFSKCSSLSQVVGLSGDAEVEGNAFQDCPLLNIKIEKSYNNPRYTPVCKELKLEKVEVVNEETILSFSLRVHTEEGSSLPCFVYQYEDNPDECVVRLPHDVIIRTADDDYSSWDYSDLETDCQLPDFKFYEVATVRTTPFSKSAQAFMLRFKMKFVDIPVNTLAFNLIDEDTDQVILSNVQLQ